MKGMAPLRPEEVLLVPTYLSSRDKALFIMGIRTGFRISELLALRIKDIYKAGEVVSRVWLSRRHTKGCLEGRTLPLHQLCRAALSIWVAELQAKGKADPDNYLFRSRKGTNRPIGRVQAWKILAKAYEKAGLDGKHGTHGLRKTFAKAVYQKTGHDLLATRQALGHRDIETTIAYLSVDQDRIDSAILAD